MCRGMDGSSRREWKAASSVVQVVRGDWGAVTAMYTKVLLTIVRSAVWVEDEGGEEDHIYIYIYMYKHVHMYSYMYTYIHTCMYI